MATVAEGLKAQLSNIEKTYGQSIAELTDVIAKSGLTKHTEVVAMLKQRYGMTHGAAHRVSLTARDRLVQPGAPSPKSVAAEVGLIYDRLLATAAALGPDVEQSPKKGYVSLRRRKQFAMLQPGAKWVNLGLVLPATKATARLEPAEKWNALFTHRVRVHAPAEIDAELLSWLAAAYRAAG
jgi:hypothetical protein